MGEWRGLPHEPKYLCGAYARSTGQPCKRFARSNGRRCKLHGGASTGPRNPAIKHGMYAKKFEELDKKINTLIKDSKVLISELK